MTGIMANIIIIAILAAIVAGSAYYVYKAKKGGAACIGCPDSKQCSGGCCHCSDSGTKNVAKK